MAFGYVSFQTLNTRIFLLGVHLNDGWFKTAMFFQCTFPIPIRMEHPVLASSKQSFFLFIFQEMESAIGNAIMICSNTTKETVWYDQNIRESLHNLVDIICVLHSNSVWQKTTATAHWICWWIRSVIRSATRLFVVSMNMDQVSTLRILSRYPVSYMLRITSNVHTLSHLIPRWITLSALNLLQTASTSTRIFLWDNMGCARLIGLETDSVKWLKLTFDLFIALLFLDSKYFV